MKYIYLVTILFFLSVNAFSQMLFENESGSHPIKDDKLEKIINKKFELPENSELEFRLHTIPTLTNGQSVFIMRLKNKIWEAYFFRKDNRDSWTAVEVDNSKLDSLWIRLEKNQVLTLPDQRLVEDRMKIFTADTTAVLEDWGHMETRIMDGVGYRFELAQYSYRKRAYSYHCPHAYLQRYPNIEELYRAYSIIVLVYKFLGISWSVC